MQNILLIHISQDTAVANINKQQWQSKHETTYGRALLLLVRNIRSTSKDEVNSLDEKEQPKQKTARFFFFLKNYIVIWHAFYKHN